MILRFGWPAADRAEETMSEAELHIIEARMLEGRRAKARRGEVGMADRLSYTLPFARQLGIQDPGQAVAEGIIRLALAQL